MIDIITGISICHINIFCYDRKYTLKYNQDNAIVCKYLKENGNAPLPEWCYNKSTAKAPKRRNEF